MKNPISSASGASSNAAGRDLKVLLIENDTHDADRILQEFKRAGYTLTTELAESAAATKTALEKESFDLILSNSSLPGFGARKVLDILGDSGKKIPLVVVSSAIGEEAAVELIKAGAGDYINKARLDLLVPAVERTLHAHHEKLLAEQAQSSREHLLAVVSHDLKNPLGGISLNLQVALKKLDEAAKTSETIKIELLRTSLERAQRSSQRMLQLIQGILDQTNIQSGKLTLRKEIASANTLMQELSELFQPLAEKSSVRLEVKSAKDDCRFEFDFERIFQALGNLVGNAIKFTPPEGVISIWYECSPHEVNFYVRDTGKGIPAEQQAFIFKRFWQASHDSGQGLGLGLSICRGIVESHHGRIQVSSEEGKGSTFQVTLPRGEIAKAVSHRFKTARILIIDDDESLGETLSETLTERGFHVDWVMDAEKGLALLTGAQAKFSLVVVDYRLPGMNGGQFSHAVRALKDDHSKLPIILCSAEPDIEETARTLPIDAILPKPTDLARFVNLVEQTLRNRALPGIPAKSINNYLVRRIEDLQSCRKSLELSDYEKIRSIAHRLKGSASTFGFPELSEIARRLELAVSAADPATIKKSVAGFEQWISEHPPADVP